MITIFSLLCRFLFRKNLSSFHLLYHFRNLYQSTKNIKVKSELIIDWFIWRPWSCWWMDTIGRPKITHWRRFSSRSRSNHVLILCRRLSIPRRKKLLRLSQYLTRYISNECFTASSNIYCRSRESRRERDPACASNTVNVKSIELFICF